ncbi:helix-turn-helix transcriptional regulator [Rhizobium leguminosarum]|uniref:AraC family transcriptional regulator n=1 Tax=Rhizobium TaxID=379 RepID=UPI0014793FF4|nr:MULTISPECIES: AraC family transcriptional regulator [Rhizobium]MBY5355046.1 helix-turn-helix transcriptional regulator [Rhizobium leguminosarum]MBY5454612.1 helix-turn-helix transcriptional regulator [Rhizobium leguminosarum]NNH41077.1 helix-turn-helix transcriptional regulator [Rhizobium laguerreae]
MKDADGVPLTAQRINVPPGGGAFGLPRLAIGIFLVPQQTHRVAIASDRKRHIPLKENEGWILPSGSVGICEYDEAHSYLFTEFTDALLSDIELDLSHGFEPVIGQLDPLLVQLAHHAAFRLDGTSPLYRETMHLALAAHLGLVLRQGKSVPISVDDKRLGRAAAYIHDNLTEDVSLEVLAAQAAMSRYHFLRAFKAAFGSSPHQYVIQQRMERAKLLLRTTGIPVVEVAFRVGYDDVSRFGRHFLRYARVNPSVYRRQ